MKKKSIVPVSMEKAIKQQRERLMLAIIERLGEMGLEGIDHLFGKKQNAQLDSYDIEKLDAIIGRIVAEHAAPVLADISHRIKIAYDVLDRATGNVNAKTQFSAHDLNLSMPILEGYNVTGDTGTGTITWSDCAVVYNGVTNNITDGNTTNKYVYWVSTTPTTFQTSNTKPTLGVSDTLVFLNDGGVPIVMVNAGTLRPGWALKDGSLGSSELSDGAVLSSKIAAGAVTDVKIADGAVKTSKIDAAAVTGAKIAANTITAGKLNGKFHILTSKTTP